jgi:hypothetical protein
MTEESRKLLAELDAWLRAEGNGRNPGTSADLVTACLFVALREGRITLPLELPFASDGRRTHEARNHCGPS